MLQCQQCGSLISTYDAEGAARIAGDALLFTLCPTCAVTNANERTLDLVRELWDASTPAGRCPHVSYDGTRCRCAAVEASEAETVCGTASLQFWCLDRKRYHKCIFFPKEQHL